MSTLNPPGASGLGRRPHAWGEASGQKNGQPVTKTVEWLFDTGADVGVVHNQVGVCFDLIATGATASPTTGRRAILMKRGLTVTVTVEDRYGITRRMPTQRDVGIKHDNSGSNVVGMDQLADIGAAIEWDPVNGVGRLLT